MQLLLKTRKSYYILENACPSMFISIRSEYATAIIDGTADY